MNSKQRRKDRRFKVKFLSEILKAFVVALESIDRGDATARQHLDKFHEIQKAVQEETGLKL